MRPSLVLVPCLLAALLAALLVAPASAALRSPQVPVLGGTLQGYLNSVGEFINVNTDQLDQQVWGSTVSNNATFTVQVELVGNASSNTIGIYNSTAAIPALYQIFPGAATTAWFVVLAFRSAPVRVVVSLFDESASFQGSTTYLGADKNAFAYYLSGPDGVLYTQDARNPGGAAQFVTYAGTSLNSGSFWICGEQTAVAGGASDRDYDDVILFLEPNLCACPAQKCSWATLKERFR
jgi:hypothetical protein